MLNENLYVESKYLAEKQEQTVKKVAKTTSSSSSSSSSGKNTTTTSSSNTSSSKNTASNRGTVTSKNSNMYVNCDQLNFRAFPSTSGKTIAKLSKGTKVYVVDEDSNGCSKIKYSGKEGYVKAEYLRGSEAKNLASNVVNINPNFKTTKSNYKIMYTKYDVVSASTSLLANTGEDVVFPKGTEVRVTAVTSSKMYKYSEIKYQGRTYYILKNNLSEKKP